MALLQHSNRIPGQHTVGPNQFRYAAGPVTISHGNNIYRIPQHFINSPPVLTRNGFENNRQYQNSFFAGSTNQFRMEDGVMILDMFAEPSPHDSLLASQGTSTAPASDVISDRMIDANLSIKIHGFCPNVSSQASSDHDICVVCQSEYENNEQIGTLKCEHQYHRDCIKKWLRKKNLCPICKATAISL